MKRFILFVALCILFFSPLANAFPPQIEILAENQIVKLANPQLLNAYIEVVVEIEAAKAFHTTSGFTPKDYKDFKDLLRYRILLLNEMAIRKLEIPRTE